MKRKIWLDLMLTFMKIGLFTFGGGYAMIALIEDNCINKKHWITEDEMVTITAIAESTPGPIAINCATYVGYSQANLAGALFATFGIVFPSFVIIYIISMFLDNFLEIKIIANAFQGIKIAVALLILDAAISMVKKMKHKPLPMAIMLASFGGMLLINANSHFLRTAGPHFPDNPGHIKRTALETSRTERRLCPANQY